MRSLKLFFFWVLLIPHPVFADLSPPSAAEPESPEDSSMDPAASEMDPAAHKHIPIPVTRNPAPVPPIREVPQPHPDPFPINYQYIPGLPAPFNKMPLHKKPKVTLEEAGLSFGTGAATTTTVLGAAAGTIVVAKHLKNKLHPKQQTLERRESIEEGVELPGISAGDSSEGPKPIRTSLTPGNSKEEKKLKRQKELDDEENARMEADHTKNMENWEAAQGKRMAEKEIKERTQRALEAQAEIDSLKKQMEHVQNTAFIKERLAETNTDLSAMKETLEKITPQNHSETGGIKGEAPGKLAKRPPLAEIPPFRKKPVISKAPEVGVSNPTQLSRQDKYKVIETRRRIAEEAQKARKFAAAKVNQESKEEERSRSGSGSGVDK